MGTSSADRYDVIHSETAGRAAVRTTMREVLQDVMPLIWCQIGQNRPFSGPANMAIQSTTNCVCGSPVSRSLRLGLSMIASVLSDAATYVFHVRPLILGLVLTSAPIPVVARVSRMRDVPTISGVIILSCTNVVASFFVVSRQALTAVIVTPIRLPAILWKRFQRLRLATSNTRFHNANYIAVTELCAEVRRLEAAES